LIIVPTEAVNDGCICLMTVMNKYWWIGLWFMIAAIGNLDAQSGGSYEKLLKQAHEKLQTDL
jgi:hypothetical protein